jgi:hypothetical protein
MTVPGAEGLIDCPMLRTVLDRSTDYWNDSCAQDELEYAVARGATGATSNPSIVLEVLRKERAYWTPRIGELTTTNPSWTETDLTWAVIEELAVRGARVLAAPRDVHGVAHEQQFDLLAGELQSRRQAERIVRQFAAVGRRVDEQCDRHVPSLVMVVQ